MTIPDWREAAISAASNLADNIRKAVTPAREFGKSAANAMSYAVANEAARVAFPTREDVARHAILLAKETTL